MKDKRKQHTHCLIVFLLLLFFSHLFVIKRQVSKVPGFEGKKATWRNEGREGCSLSVRPRKPVPLQPRSKGPPVKLELEPRPGPGSTAPDRTGPCPQRRPAPLAAPAHSADIIWKQIPAASQRSPVLQPWNPTLTRDSFYFILSSKLVIQKA